MNLPPDENQQVVPEPAGEAAAAPGAAADDAGDIRALLDELKARVAEIRAHEIDLQRREAELEQSQQRLAEQDPARFAERVRRTRRRLQAMKAELDRKAAELARPSVSAPSANSADAASQQIDARRAEVDKLYAQASAQVEQARRRQAESARVQQQLAAREIELRRGEMQIEVDREALGRQAAELTAERERAEAKAHRTPHPPPDESPISAPFIHRSTLRRRVFGAAALGGIAAVAAWFVDRPAWRVSTALTVDSQRTGREQAAADHLGEMRRIDLASLLTDETLRGEWMLAVEAGRGSLTIAADGCGVLLSLNGSPPERQRAVLAALASAYVSHAAALDAEHFGSAELSAWRERRAANVAERAAVAAAAESLDARLRSSAGYEGWDRARVELDTLQSEFAAVSQQLEARRGELSTLAAAETPRGVVLDDAFDAALAADAVYLEDTKEFSATSRRYRVDLAVAMVVADEPLQELRESIRQLVASLTEQRDLQPPAGLRSALEQSLAQADEFAIYLAGVLQRWSERRGEIERLDRPEQAGELASRHTLAAQEGARVVTLGRELAASIASRLDELTTGGNAGTRETVVASVIRGALSGLTDRLSAVSTAVAKVDLQSNFELDAIDRQLRGLRTRLNDQREAVRRRLAAEADAAAAAAHRTAIQEASERVATLESQREELARRLGESLGRMNEMELATRELRMLGAEKDSLDRSLGRLDERLAALDAEKPSPPPDRVAAGDVQIVQIAGTQRSRNAAVAGVGGVVAGLILTAAGRGGSPRTSRGAAHAP